MPLIFVTRATFDNLIAAFLLHVVLFTSWFSMVMLWFIALCWNWAQCPLKQAHRPSKMFFFLFFFFPWSNAAITPNILKGWYASCSFLSSCVSIPFCWISYYQRVCWSYCYLLSDEDKKTARGKPRRLEVEQPTKEELRNKICEILKEVDFNTVGTLVLEIVWNSYITGKLLHILQPMGANFKFLIDALISLLSLFLFIILASIWSRILIPHLLFCFLLQATFTDILKQLGTPFLN